MPDSQSDKPFWNRDLATNIFIGFLFAVPGVYFAGFPDDAKKLVLDLGQKWPSLAIVIFILFELGLVVFTLRRWRGMAKLNGELTTALNENKKLQERVDSITRNVIDTIAGKDWTFQTEIEPESSLSNFIPYRKDKKPRWGAPRTIRYGYLEYAPFLSHTANGGAEGPALDILNKLLAPVKGTAKVELLEIDEKRNWGNIIDGLVQGEYDIVATPLFATFDRSRKVRFTAPLFYSNIGLYVNREHAHDSVWEDLTEETLQDKIISRCGHLTFLSVDGEISQKLAAKYASKSESRSGDTSFVSLFKKLATKGNDYALFCESFRAELDANVASEEDQQKPVVNVLRKLRIWYPVCFAVRIGDYQLANLLNLLLLQFHQEDDVLDYLATSIEKVPRPPTTDEQRERVRKLKEKLKRHFVSEWPAETEKVEALRA